MTPFAQVGVDKETERMPPRPNSDTCALQCLVCLRVEVVANEHVFDFFLDGWPRCCDREMLLSDEPAEEPVIVECRSAAS